MGRRLLFLITWSWSWGHMPLIVGLVLIEKGINGSVCSLSFNAKIGVYNMRQIKKLTWLQACFLGDVGVIWCNSLSDSLFQIYVMNFVEIALDFYSHITSHVSQVFASCTQYTSHSLLNFVHIIVCDFVLAIQDWKFHDFNAKCV